MQQKLLNISPVPPWAPLLETVNMKYTGGQRVVKTTSVIIKYNVTTEVFEKIFVASKGLGTGIRFRGFSGVFRRGGWNHLLKIDVGEK